jgi:hypothetical protein
VYGVARRHNRSWLDYANYYLGEKRFEFKATLAAGGNTIAQILAQIQTAVTYGYAWVIGDLGIVNSVVGGVPMATMKSQIAQCCDAFS